MSMAYVSVGHSDRMARAIRRLQSVRFDSDCISSLSLLIFYVSTFIPTETID